MNKAHPITGQIIGLDGKPLKPGPRQTRIIRNVAELIAELQSLDPVTRVETIQKDLWYWDNENPEVQPQDMPFLFGFWLWVQENQPALAERYQTSCTPELLDKLFTTWWKR